MYDLENDHYVYPGQRISKSGYKVGQGQGMTLRDYFAGQVLAGSFSGVMPKALDVSWMQQHGSDYAYHIADAMLAARLKQKKTTA